MNALSPNSAWQTLRRVIHHAQRAQHRWIWLLIVLLALILVLLFPARGATT
jgi:hypothetical protein